MTGWVAWLLVGGGFVLVGIVLMLVAGVTAVSKQREKDGDLIAVAGFGVLSSAIGMVIIVIDIVWLVADFLGSLLT